MDKKLKASKLAFRLQWMAFLSDKLRQPPRNIDYTPEVIADGCLQYHRGDVTKALRHVGHVIAEIEKTGMWSDFTLSRLRHQVYAIRTELYKIRNGVEVLRRESPALPPGGAGSTPASAATEVV